MRFVRYNNTNDFLADCIETLLEYEAQNNKLIGSALKGKSIDTANWQFAAIKDDCDDILIAALCEPNRSVNIFAAGNKINDEALTLIVKELTRDGSRFYGVLAERSLAEAFSYVYRLMTGSSSWRDISMNCMVCRKPVEASKAHGYLRNIIENDFYYLPYWKREFAIECGLEASPLEAYYRILNDSLQQNNHYIWEDAQPAFTAQLTRKTVNGAVISGVYTPPHLRGRGYASAAMYALSRKLISEGYEFCALFADTDNPVSNKIYSRIGYEAVCIFDEYKFTNK